jgi:hypothetical protein
MNQEYAYTALIDVLAYKYRLKLDQENGRYSFKEDLEAALGIIDQFDGTFTVQAISDTIILTCNESSNFIEFLRTIKKVFINFLGKGLFIRGGIAYAKHYHSGYLTYSHAVAKAYKLENEKAIYPRILIDENIIQMHAGSNLPDIQGESLLVKQNGLYFINIIDDENWQILYNLASQLYENDKANILKDEGPFSKHSWFENYLFSAKPTGIEIGRYIDNIEIF